MTGPAAASLVALSTLAALAGPTSAATQGPLDVEAMPADGGPATFVHAEASPLVALRLSFPVPAGAPEGVVELLQELARPAARAEAARLGADLALRHEAGRAVITVAGPATAFDALVRILRRATGEPGLGVAELRAARARAEDRVLGRVERPGPRARLSLWHALFGGPPPGDAPGTRLGPEAVRVWRARLYAPGAGTLVLVGGVPPAVVRAALGGWADPSTGAAVPPASPTDVGVAAEVPAAAEGAAPGAGAPTRAPAHQLWAAIGYRLRSEPAALAVAAELVDRRVRASALREGAAEAWPGPGGGALVLVGAGAMGDRAALETASLTPLVVRDRGAPDPESGGSPEAAAVGAYLRRMIAEAAALTGPADVDRAATALRDRLLREARSAPGKAEVIGRLADALGSPTAATTFLERLDRVDHPAVMALLEAALAAPATLAEAAP